MWSFLPQERWSFFHKGPGKFEDFLQNFLDLKNSRQSFFAETSN